MSADQSQEEEIFHAAMDITSPAERAEYLDKACGENAALRLYCSGFLGIGAVLDFDENRSDRQRDRRSRNDGHKV